MSQNTNIEEVVNIPEETVNVMEIKKGKGHRLQLDKPTHYKSFLDKKNAELYERLPMLINEQLWKFQQEKDSKKEERLRKKAEDEQKAREQAEFEQFKALKKIKESGKDVVDKKEPQPLKQYKSCQYCNNNFLARNITTHEKRCSYNPDSKKSKPLKNKNENIAEVAEPVEEQAPQKPTVRSRFDYTDSIW